MTCPKCKKKVTRLLALSRFSDEMICSLCGSKEAFESMKRAGIISEEVFAEKCKELEAVYEKSGITE